MLIVSESDEEEDYILVTEPEEPIVDCCLDGRVVVGASSNSGNNSASIGARAGTKLRSLSPTEESLR